MKQKNPNDNKLQIHMTGASTNPKKGEFEKDLNCMIDFVKVQPPIFVFNSAIWGFFSGWGQVQKIFSSFWKYSLILLF